MSPAHAGYPDDAMSAPQHATAWDDLPLGVQQHILMLTGTPRARRVSKAWRDTFDAANDTLCFRRVPHTDQSLKAVATAAATRIISRSAHLTSINMVDEFYNTLPVPMLDLLAASAASGLATRLRTLTGVEIEAARATQQLQALRHYTSLTHLDIRGGDLLMHLQRNGHVAAFNSGLAAALQGLRSLIRLRVAGCERRGDTLAVPLASAVQPLTQLQHLNLTRNDMGIAALAALLPALSAMPALQTLVIIDIDESVYPKDRASAEWAKALRALLSVVPGLTHLDVCNTSLQAEGVALLAPVLRGMTRLQHLNLSHNSVGSSGMAALAPALAALPSLHTLDLSGCGLEDGFVSLLQPVLSKTGCPLRKLALGQTCFTLTETRALAAGLSTAPQLQELNLQFISMRDDWDESWMALAPGLSRLGPSLHTLELSRPSGCDFSAAASVALAAALQSLTGLTCLQAINLFSPATLATISPALMGMRRLQVPAPAPVLVLSAIRLSVEGTAAFAKVLSALSGSLTHLYLSHCSLGAEAAAGVLALAQALAQATGLVELHLCFDHLGPLGGLWLPPVLTALPCLRKVNLRECGLGAQGCLAIVGALKDRDDMFVQLCGNGIAMYSSESKALCRTPGICVYW